MSEQRASGGEWSKTPPQQGGKGARNRNPDGSKGQGKNRAGKGKGGQSQQTDSTWSSEPQHNEGRPQQQQQGPSQSRYSGYSQAADEMNLREVSSPRRQPPNSQQGAGWKGEGKGDDAQAQVGSSKGDGKGGDAKARARAQQMQARKGRAEQEEREQDTIIGKGFTAAMKRGVAQAKPTPMHEEMVPQKDGGFIATIQKGFEGLFGKPTSKEEVLRKRGAVWANEYEAVPGDEIDQRVQFFARRLPEDVAGCLKIFRKAKGEYQINDEIVNMDVRTRVNPQNPQGQPDKEIFAFWTTEEGEQSDPEPLGLYLSHAANVAYEVKQGGNVITQVPEAARMSFHEEIGTKLTDGSADARFNAMEVAARQAKMREEAAMEWREKQNNPQKPEDDLQQSEEPQKDAASPAANQEGSLFDGALQAIGLMQPAPAPTPVPQMTLAAPAAAGPSRSSMPGLPMPAGLNVPMGANAGTFYGVQQAPFGQQLPGLPRQGTMYEQGGAMQQLPRQGTMYGSVGGGSMYAFGSASPPAVTAAAAGYPAPMQRQGYASSGSMYAYGSAYPVPVR